MKIAVIGLGLIGGSFCKAIKNKTTHTCWGLDTDGETLRQALEQQAIDRAIIPADLSQADVTIVCLHPRQSIAFILEHSHLFQKNSIVIDTCGVKQAVMDQACSALSKEKVIFIGTHPMAGREFSGFAYSCPDLFENASFILTPPSGAPQAAVDKISALAHALGFGKIVKTSAEIHDREIAFTSQLAHVVSNAYIKSPAVENQSGFSAGSFLDLTRVAKLNENMWTDLFMMNRENLLQELDILLTHLQQYRRALAQEDAESLRQLLKQGRILKEKSQKRD